MDDNRGVPAHATLPTACYAVNLCEDRYAFLVAFCAVASRGQTNLLPPSRAMHAIDEVLAGHPGSYAVGDTPRNGLPAHYLQLALDIDAIDADLTVPEIDATLNQPAAGISGLPVKLENAGPGHFLSYGLNIPLAGTWTLEVTVRTNAVDEYYANPVAIHIR